MIHHKAARFALTSLILLTLVSADAGVRAQTTEQLKVLVQITFFSSDQDVRVTQSEAITHDAFEDLIKRHTSGKKKKMHVWSSNGKTVTAGESFDLSISPTSDGREVEVLQIGTSEFGEGGHRVALSISALKRRLETETPRYSIIQRWGLNSRIVVPVGGVTIVGGQQGDPYLGKKAEKKMPPQLLYIAIGVKRVTD